MRINDEITDKLTIVDSVSKYINNLDILQKEWCDDNWFMLYRGEPEEYGTPCIPTIYRGFALGQNPNYEENMFLAMRQNSISNSDDFLHNAIDAQHDGFPSRLLDVTYNSLVALYFAVTPYYYKEESSSDNKDGIVYVVKFDEAYSPESINTKEIYKTALKGGNELSNAAFLSHHHILIDHCKQNKRIIAQQGAFILFTGDSPVPIPYYQMCGIRISKYAKDRIRNELRYMFGIYTGSVYPEVELMHEEIKSRCMRLNAYCSDWNRSTEAALDDIEEEYDYFGNCCEYFVREGKTKGELVRFIEKSIVIHKNHLKEYWERLQIMPKDEKGFDLKEHLISRYNEILTSFINELPKEIKVLIDEEVKGKVEVNNYDN